MEKVPTPLESIRILAQHKRTKEMCEVLLIDRINKYVDVLPESELEGGNQVSWNFEDINIFIKL